jgi:hypothetical protein
LAIVDSLNANGPVSTKPGQLQFKPKKACFASKRHRGS